MLSQNELSSDLSDAKECWGPTPQTAPCDMLLLSLRTVSKEYTVGWLSTLLDKHAYIDCRVSTRTAKTNVVGETITRNSLIPNAAITAIFLCVITLWHRGSALIRVYWAARAPPVRIFCLRWPNANCVSTD